jgi:hypothetical protein
VPETLATACAVHLDLEVRVAADDGEGAVEPRRRFDDHAPRHWLGALARQDDTSHVPARQRELAAEGTGIVGRERRRLRSGRRDGRHGHRRHLMDR